RIGPGDFFQTNPSTADVLYRRTIELLDLQQDEAFLDLYCGVGGLALQGARKTGWAMGIEEVEGAVLHARDAARRNGLSAQFLCGEVREELPQVQKLLGNRGCAISVNPARRGLEEDVIEGIVALKPSRVAYISCNPRAFARDLQAFREAGLEIGEVELFDMFPNTAHVECLVVLRDPTVSQGKVRAPRRRVVRR
ncbi:MAG: 23S rRNA (uracil1939-C5)-methyltransferase, partial [Kiritimatiellia bacterium]